MLELSLKKDQMIACSFLLCCQLAICTACLRFYFQGVFNYFHVSVSLVLGCSCERKLWHCLAVISPLLIVLVSRVGIEIVRMQVGEGNKITSFFCSKLWGFLKFYRWYFGIYSERGMRQAEVKGHGETVEHWWDVHICPKRQLTSEERL